MAKSTKKNQKNPFKSTKSKDGAISSIEDKGLRLSWIRFIDAYIENGGNGKDAYLKAYPNCTSNNGASVEAVRLLRNPNILQELNNKLSAQTCTDEFIVSGLVEIATKYRGAKTINAAVKSYEILAKVRGLLVDTKKIAFTGDNPAVFLPVYSKEEKEKFDKIKESKQRIVE